ncbi:hypothetical protein GLOIN_2v1787182 [Rhizophagus irregularis DAOM 181602=DAOM 197198]|uniref:Uncharacterized protein n=1 Tax=Rhizophagus irregularis (strain DAOM 181602 / DAOM 197198 / MUCL 43194) TaxID=747089 RepID=A0A2P4P6D0_RHIID|nr:hypothetical protein GLOIN_2v1787182 [Rhizophagus irregularis DAOM 181602=DAOM 197198]POG60945.1 hypothetical protein GLOIN_2v1787182 [Rhizophagus irregularis DAOM 181602=DAOM 197198]GET64270.1 hypothetical protein GLOIN_2v1787182 [Rhizophagus irregularis DAOM 181602=DAOM 197198]|eukprot:XP_025167811.1 hypothetical protein GLOIN_2v1787182 [Rhizophagus irregularis DAOM 181602=DAOM 197198]
MKHETKAPNGFENVTHIRGTQLIGNDKDHTPFALMEKKGQPDKIYRRIDCTLVVTKKNICENCTKLQNTIGQNEIIVGLKERLEEKIKKEEVEVSDNIANITHIVTKDVINKNINFSTLHPIFQELIRIQTGKPKDII